MMVLSVKKTAKSSDALMSQVQTSAVKLVRFLYCDTSSIIRGKATHVERLKPRLEQGIGLVKGMMSMNMLDALQSSTGYGATGEVRLVPDPDTFVILPYAQHSAVLLCDLVELDHQPWALCPRNILKRQIEKAAQMGIRIEASFEPEFTLGTKNEIGDLVPIDESLCFSSDGMNKGAQFIDRFVHSLVQQGIQVEQYYPELGHGQHELSISHAPALKAADRQVLYRETLRGVAAELNMVASLAPKPFVDQAGNGCHLHVSAWEISSGKSLLWSADSENNFSEFGRWFVAGIVKHLPALVALTCASANSYRRLKPRSWSSAYTVWGFENREAAVRIPTQYWGDEQGTTNLEIKCVDSSCNPYLALAAVIAAGLEGVEDKLPPPQPVQVDPASLSADQQKKAGIKRLPASLTEALRQLAADKLLTDVLGAEMTKTYLAVKGSEADTFSKKPVKFEIEQHRTKF
jgi:glutamine synthetase